MEQNIGLFSAKLEDLAEKAALMQRHIAELESADPDEAVSYTHLTLPTNSLV